MNIEETFKALKLEQGGIYVLESDKPLSLEQMEYLQKAVSGISERLDIKLIVLPAGFRIARDKAA